MVCLVYKYKYIKLYTMRQLCKYGAIKVVFLTILVIQLLFMPLETRVICSLLYYFKWSVMSLS